MFRLKITRHKTEYGSFSMSHGGHIGVPNQPCWFTKNHLTRVRYIENLDLTNF